MTAYNVVRFRVKPGSDEAFVERQRASFEGTRMEGNQRIALVKTGDSAYCVVGIWDSFDAIVAARPAMIAALDDVRDLLEDLGNGLGLTDPVSGDAVLELAH
jgi:quinol monooxygenase YgiN